MSIIFIHRLDKVVHSINKTIANISKKHGGDHDGLTHSLMMHYSDLYLVNKEEKGNNKGKQ